MQADKAMNEMQSEKVTSEMQDGKSAIEMQADRMRAGRCRKKKTDVQTSQWYGSGGFCEWLSAERGA